MKRAQVALLATLLALFFGNATGASDSGAPVHITAKQDRERLLKLLGLTDAQMRPRPATDPKAPDATNYDETKVHVYQNLPDALAMKDGRRVTSAKMWWDERRPQIVADFEHEILGRAPRDLPNVQWEVVNTTPSTYKGRAVVTKRLVGHVDNSRDPLIPVNIEMLLTTPASPPAPVPVIMELAFAPTFESALQGPILGEPGKWGVPWQPVLDRGWGFAILSPTSFQADNGAGLTQGIIGLMNKGEPRGLDEWGTLRAWAWGASRALDYLETDKAVDAKQVGLEGHSRFGKEVLVAMAYDPRFAIGYSSSSGEGGAKLYRHIFGEQITNLAGSDLYHWFNGNFLRYGGPLNEGNLPVDAHELIALCAPRPLFIGGGSSVGDGYAEPGGDAWADTRGMFLAEVAASPVYRLLGKTGLETTTYPPVGTALIRGNLGFRQHADGHTPVPNWPAFLDFASRYLQVGPSKRPSSRD